MARKAAVLDQAEALVNSGGSKPAARSLADLSRAERDEAYALTGDEAKAKLAELAKYRKVLADLGRPGMEITLAEFTASEALADWRRAIDATIGLEPALLEVAASDCILPFQEHRAERAGAALAAFDDERFIRQLTKLGGVALSRGTAVFPRLVTWPAEGEAVTPDHFEVLALAITQVEDLPRSRRAKAKRTGTQTTDGEGASVTVREPIIRLKPGAARYAAIQAAAAADGLSVEAYIFKQVPALSD